MPGYYNSAWGVTVTAAPTTSSYASYGIYDGSGATGTQTGIQTFPTFNSYYFNIGEIGTSWAGDYPGSFYQRGSINRQHAIGTE
jgi:porin